MNDNQLIAKIGRRVVGGRVCVRARERA